MFFPPFPYVFIISFFSFYFLIVCFFCFFTSFPSVPCSHHPFSLLSSLIFLYLPCYLSPLLVRPNKSSNLNDHIQWVVLTNLQIRLIWAYPTIAPPPVAFVHAFQKSNFKLLIGTTFWKSSDLRHMTQTHGWRSNTKKVGFTGRHAYNHWLRFSPTRLWRLG